MELPELYEALRRFEEWRGSVEIGIGDSINRVVVDNTLAQMACCIAREHLRREISMKEAKMMQKVENEDFSI